MSTAEAESGVRSVSTRHRLFELLGGGIWASSQRRKGLGVLSLMACATGIAGLVWPLSTQQAIDSLTTSSWKSFLFQCGVLMLSFFGQGLIGFLSTVLSSSIVQSYVCELRESCFENQLIFSSVNRVETGDALVTITSDCARVGSLGVAIVSSLASALLSLIGTVAAMVVLSPALLAVSLIPVPCMALIYHRWAPKLVESSNRERLSLGRLSALVKDHLDKARVLRGLSGESESCRTIHIALDEYRTSNIKAVYTSTQLNLLTTTVSVTGQLLVLVSGGLLYLSGKVTLGTVFAFGALSSRLSGPIMALWSLKGAIDSALPSINRVYDAVYGVPDAKVSRVLVTENMNALVRVIREKLKPGKLIALGGAVGAGKSMLCLRLMIELWKDGRHDVEQEAAFYLPQNPLLPRGTIRSILTMGLGYEADDSELIQALSSVGLLSTVWRFPDKLDTELGPQGVELSAGETQKLLLARAMLRPCRLVILDEALSSLDANSALEILRCLKKRLCTEGSTVLLVTHREEEVAIADEYYVLDGGVLRQTSPVEQFGELAEPAGETAGVSDLGGALRE
ncbi:MAG TPA: ABC transporter ATP-binding protein [Firmicutes bacterium]|nr:ABC transporter ATP-binding protein [Candidatus Fermentithermobacillaceae bacterium]